MQIESNDVEQIFLYFYINNICFPEMLQIMLNNIEINRNLNKIVRITIFSSKNNLTTFRRNYPLD